MSDIRIPTKEELKDLLERGVTECIVKEELEKQLLSGKKLRVKLGFDPTGPKLHIGRAITLRKLQKFQQLGHQLVFIIGDFTGQVGDASDKDAERQMLSEETVKENMKNYLDQLKIFFDLNEIEVHYNSTWLKPLGFQEIAQLAQNFSVAEMLDRENFSKRYKDGKRISLHEFLYPLMQGYDSVAIQADLETGGNDQLFNLHAGRKLQPVYGQKPQSIMTYELLEGTDGRKMSTSWGNCIYIQDEPNEIFGKIMSMKDELILRYFTLCTDTSFEEIEKMKTFLETGGNPRDLKIKLGKELVTIYYDEDKANEAENYFINTFQKKEFDPSTFPTLDIEGDMNTIADVMVNICGIESKGEAKRLIAQNAVRILNHPEHGEVTITTPDYLLNETNKSQGVILQIGKKKFYNVRLK